MQTLDNAAELNIDDPQGKLRVPKQRSRRLATLLVTAAMLLVARTNPLLDAEVIGLCGMHEMRIGRISVDMVVEERFPALDFPRERGPEDAPSFLGSFQSKVNFGIGHSVRLAENRGRNMTSTVSAAVIACANAEETPYQSTKGAFDVASDTAERAVLVIDSALSSEGGANAHIHAS
jgi:hypothetical protein